MTIVAAFTAVYGLLLIAGGVAGYLEAHSKPSLISGAASGVLALLAAALIGMGQRGGLIMALVVAVALAAFGGKSWLIDHKAFMPRGLIFVLSVAELLAVVLTLLRTPGR